MLQTDRRFRLFRLSLLGTGILLLLQYIFGMLVNLYVEFPTDNALGWAFKYSAFTQIHAYLGTLLLVVALAALVLSILVRSLPGIVASVIGLAMNILAYLSGLWFLLYGQQAGNSLWMALGFVGAIVAYGFAYFLSRPTIQAKGSPLMEPDSK